MTSQKVGRLVYRYIGDYGNHTSLFIDDKEVFRGFYCNSSILFSLWCVSDYTGIPIEKLLTKEFAYAKTDFSNGIIKKLFTKPGLYSKYDIIYNHYAPGLYYHELFKAQIGSAIVLSAKKDIEDTFISKYKLTSLEIEYEFDQDAVWTSC